VLGAFLLGVMAVVVADDLVRENIVSLSFCVSLLPQRTKQGRRKKCFAKHGWGEFNIKHHH